ADFGRDITRSVRTLVASPGYTVVALLSLSMGICIAACAFSEMNGIVLRNLPVISKPDELVALELPVTYPEFKRYRERSDVFVAAAAYIAPVPFTLSFAGHKERIWGHLVSGSYFSTLGVAPAMGRLFGAAEEEAGTTPEVVLSYRFWEEKLGRAAVVGKTLQVNGRPCTVVGIGPKNFLGASPALYVADIWIPVTVDSHLAPELENDTLKRNDLALFHVIGRLKPGMNSERAESELDAVAKQLERDNGMPSNLEKGRHVTLSEGGKLLPLRKQDLPFFTSFFLIMAGLVMLIAFANVANMMLARSTKRRREIAIRLALGAGRGRILRLLGTESMLIAAGAGALGFAMSIWLMDLNSHLRMPFPIPVSYDLRPDWRVLLLTLAVTAGVGFGFGLTPAIRFTQENLVPALKEGGRVLLPRFRRLSMRNVLMVAQVAGSLTLLVILGLLSVGIQTTLGIQAGFNPRGLYLVSLDPVRDGYSGDQSASFLHKVLERVKTMPGVSSATLTETIPVSLGITGLRFSEPISGADNSQEVRDALKYTVGKDYFDTSGIPIVQGRGFRSGDDNNGSTAVIVSEELVREYWAGQNPLGRRIQIENAEAFAPKIMPGSMDYRPAVPEGSPRTYEVIGVAGDVANDLVINRKRPAVYFPLRNADVSSPSLQGITLLVRATPGSNILELLRREISALDANVVPFDARSMNEHIADFIAPLRSAAWTYGIIGIFGMVLASVGLAGMTAYSVVQRRREMGIRMALGAGKGDVVRAVMKQGMMLIGIGTTIGLGCAWAGSRMLSAMNSSVGQVTTRNASDPTVLFGAPLLLGSVALLACYLPARKSSRVEPLSALHEE
ncbi:MAG TPA: ABC transporter permease, partial [Candidatus Sulfotelmatobacter sp.]|nr:ABC transporter permease [Candidatus Sulfotelmatobacter sp.]